jgi:hypothetical protein
MKFGQMFAGAGVTLLGVCFGFAIATNADAAAEAKWWDLMTAFGTVGAVLVAIWFGLSDVRMRGAERARACNVYQWYFLPEIGQAKPVVNSMIEFIERIEREEVGFEINQADLEYLDLLCKLIQLPTINAHIAALVHLPEEHGRLLAKIASNGTEVAYRMRQLMENPIVTVQLKKYAASQRVLLETLRDSIDATGWFQK